MNVFGNDRINSEWSIYVVHFELICIRFILCPHSLTSDIAKYEEQASVGGVSKYFMNSYVNVS